MKYLGAPITNTALLGVVAKATEIVSMDGIEKTVNSRFKAVIAEKNMAVIKQAFEEAKVE